MKNLTSSTQIVEAIQASGLKNGIVCLHSSLKSFGFLQGGADAILQAFIENGCTLVVPTFTYDCEVSTPSYRRIIQNGSDYSESFDSETAVAYDKNSPMISREMGAIPARLLEMKARARGRHPLNSFAALGPLAKELIGAQSPLNVYGTLKAIYAHKSAAYLVLAGVDLTSATPIHFAEERAGRRLFRRWAKGNNMTLEVEVGSCSDGFNNLAPYVKNIETSIQVGQSVWKIYPFRTFIDTVARAIVQNPAVTHCADQKCIRCNDSVRGGPFL